MDIRYTYLLGVGFVLSGVLLVWKAPLSRVVIFPAPGVQALQVSDPYTGGNSWCRIQPSTEGVRYSFGLRPGAPYPYAGLKLNLKADLTGATALEIGMKADSGVALRFSLKSPAPELKRPTDPSAMFYHEIEYEPFGKDTLRSFAFTEFRFPHWWCIREKWPEEQKLDRLNDVKEMEILNGFEQVKRDSTTVEIRSIVALYTPLWAYILSAIFFAIGFGVIAQRFLKYHKNRPEEGSPFEGYRKTEMGKTLDPLQERLLAHLKEHYGNSDYSLEILSKAAGTSERQASESLKAITGTHFKAALNEIRLTEALRLLQLGQGSVSEIAYAVGFNNHAHFTRAFKAKFGKSPTEMRIVTD